MLFEFFGCGFRFCLLLPDFCFFLFRFDCNLYGISKGIRVSECIGFVFVFVCGRFNWNKIINQFFGFEIEYFVLFFVFVPSGRGNCVQITKRFQERMIIIENRNMYYNELKIDFIELIFFVLCISE